MSRTPTSRSESFEGLYPGAQVTFNENRPLMPLFPSVSIWTLHVALEVIQGGAMSAPILLMPRHIASLQLVVAVLNSAGRYLRSIGFATANSKEQAFVADDVLLPQQIAGRVQGVAFLLKGRSSLQEGQLNLNRQLLLLL